MERNLIPLVLNHIKTTLLKTSKLEYQSAASVGYKGDQLVDISFDTIGKKMIGLQGGQDICG